jgi:signal peptidase II
MEAGERRKYGLFAALAVVSAALDQASKIWARGRLPAFGRAGMPVWDRKLVMVYSENPGIAFSQLQGIQGGRVVLSLVSLVALVLVARYLHRTPPSRPAMVAALGLISGGAVGNVIDRISRGKVTDFVMVDLGFWPLNPWPVFNVADAALVAGAILMAIAVWRTRHGGAS